MEKDISDSKKTEDLAKRKLEFDILKLRDENPAVYMEYFDLLIKKQINLLKENGNKPVIVTTEQKENLIKQAHTNIIMGHVDPAKMERDWERASENGRPPIGGAQDD